MMHIVFEELNHIYYTIIDDVKVKPISVTKFIGLYKKPYLVEFWSVYTAVRLSLELERKEFSAFCTKNDFKFYKFDDNEKAKIAYLKSCIDGKFVKNKKVNWENALIGKEYVKQVWNDKKELKGKVGTEFHEFMEKKAHEEKYEFINDEKRDLASNAVYQTKGLKYSVDLTKLEDGYHSEVLLYTDVFNIEGGKYYLLLSGQVDKLFVETINGIRYVDIDDYKTNDKITTENSYNKLLAPVNHLEDTKLICNSLQIGLYARLLEEHGFVPRNLFFTHHDIAKIGMTDSIDEKRIGEEYKKPYELKYYKYELESMIKDYCLKNRLKIEGKKFEIIKEYIL